LNSMAAAPMMSFFVLIVDPFSLMILSAWVCVGSPAYASGVSI
jgi:hypothetical protein